MRVTPVAWYNDVTRTKEERMTGVMEKADRLAEVAVRKKDRSMRRLRATLRDLADDLDDLAFVVEEMRSLWEVVCDAVRRGEIEHGHQHREKLERGIGEV